jgi:hypothetical protein
MTSLTTSSSCRIVQSSRVLINNRCLLCGVKRKCAKGTVTSPFDPNVWSGRAVQEAFGRRWLMRSCVNVFGLRLEHVLRAIMDISAHAI